MTVNIKNVFSALILFLLIGGLSPVLAQNPNPNPENSPAERAGKPAGEEEKKKKSTELVSLDFDGVDIKVVLKYMSEITKKNFLIDDNVRGKVTILSPKKISIDEVYKVLESILEVQGYSAVVSGEVVKVVPSMEGKARAIDTKIGKDEITSEDRMITQIIPLDYANVNEVRNLIAPLISKNSNVIAYVPTNTLILTDISSNIKRLVDIIREIDVEVPEVVIEIVSLSHAAADMMATQLSTIIEGVSAKKAIKQSPGAPGPGRAFKAIADKRTNTLIMVALPDYIDKAKFIIQKLDIEVVKPDAEIHVYFLENAKAEDMAKVLTGQAAQLMRDKGGVGGGVPPPPTPQAQRTNITITPDKPTNALVISASAEDYKILKDIIEKLDIMRSQVLVEALIVDVSLQKSEQLGVEWRFLQKIGGDGLIPAGGTNFGNMIGGTQAGLASGSPNLVKEGLLVAAVKGSINVGGKAIPNIPGIINALQKDQDSDILSTPHILTMDNEEAEIKVGEQRAFVTRSTTDVTNLNATVRNYEYKDLGITLRITPHISKDKYVRLEISQEIKDFIPEASTTDAITTTNKSTKTTVTVANGEMVVIGGLISKSTKKNISKIPCLGSIPIISWLFKSLDEKKEKRNLILFITPHIITSPEKMEELTKKKKAEAEMSTKEERDKIKVFEDMKLLVK